RWARISFCDMPRSRLRSSLSTAWARHRARYSQTWQWGFKIIGGAASDAIWDLSRSRAWRDSMADRVGPPGPSSLSLDAEKASPWMILTNGVGWPNASERTIPYRAASKESSRAILFLWEKRTGT